MNEFKSAFQALASVEATLRCGCRLSDEDHFWSISLCKMCKSYIEALDIWTNDFTLE